MLKSNIDEIIENYLGSILERKLKTRFYIKFGKELSNRYSNAKK